MLQEKNVYMEVHTRLTAEPQLCVAVGPFRQSVTFSVLALKKVNAVK